MHSKASFIVPCLGMTALGALIKLPTVPLSLPSVLAVAGKDVDQPEDPQPCGKGETIETCAGYMSAMWEVPTNPQCEPQQIKIPVVWAPGVLEGYIQPLVHVDASECKLSEPHVVPQGEPFYCSKAFTSTEHFGMSSTLSIALSEEVDVPLVAKFQTTLTESETETYDDTTSVANASTTTTSWTLQNGDVCQPAVVQYGIQCQTTIRVADSATEWTFHKTASAKGEKDNMSTVSCNDLLNGFIIGGKTFNPAFSQFCDAIKAESKETTINVGISGSTDGIWSLQGCTWPTKTKGN